MKNSIAAKKMVIETIWSMAALAKFFPYYAPKYS
jgi:hypothetical protein